MKSVSKINSGLSRLEDQLTDEVMRRESVYDSRTDKWKNSEKGIQYFEETDILREALMDMQSAIHSLSSVSEEMMV